MPKAIVVFFIVILFIFLAIIYYSGLSPFKRALPWQSCGGSTSAAKECISGFTCTYSYPECDGCGGVCVPNKK
jgi:hypothetical protein